MDEVAVRTSWIVQANIPNSDSTSLLETACQQLGLSFFPVTVEPRQKHLPDIAGIEAPLVFHGATTLVLRASETPEVCRGVFYDPSRFTHEAYGRGFGEAYLNYDAQVMDWSSLLAEASAASTSFFIKPPDDLKAFTGCVAGYAGIQKLYQKLAAAPDRLPGNVIVGRQYEVDAEWRLFVVDGEIITGSMYRPTADRHLPSELLDFATRSISRWSPAEVFVLDVGRVHEQWRIIECNCFNWSRFYLSDVRLLVDRISQYQEDNW